jgi:3-oxoacyl-[acyl-carrier-protein] synthase II
MVLLAAKEALDHAGLSAGAPRAEVGVFLDRAFGPSHTPSRMAEPFLARGPQAVSPIVFAQTVANAPAGAVARLLGTRGPNLQTMGGGALYLAVQALRRGETGMVLAGGFESVQPDHVLAESKLGRERPFGEGAIVLLLETAGHAASRGARVHAWVRGIAVAADEDECVARALRDAGVTDARSAPRAGDLRALLGDTLGMSAAASLAWACATCAEGAARLVVDAGAPHVTPLAAVVEGGAS